MTIKASNRPVAYPGDDSSPGTRGPVFPRLDLERISRHLPHPQRIRIEINGSLCGAPIAIPDAVSEFAIGWAFANRFFDHVDQVSKVSATSSHVSLMVDGGCDLDRCRYEAIGWIPRQDLELDAESTQTTRNPRAVPVMTELEAVGAAEAAFQQFERDGAKAGFFHAGLATVEDVDCIARDLSGESAVQKVVGWAISERFDTGLSLMVVHGMVDRDVVETVARVGCPILVSDSVPTLPAIEMAKTRCLTLVGLARSTRRGVFVDGGHLGDTTFPEWENLFGISLIEGTPSKPARPGGRNRLPIRMVRRVQ